MSDKAVPDKQDWCFDFTALPCMIYVSEGLAHLDGAPLAHAGANHWPKE